MPLLLDLLAHILMFAETYLGIGFAGLTLSVIVLLRHYHHPNLCIHANVADWAALAYVGMQFVTLAFSKGHPNTIHFIAPYASALCLYFTIRLLLPWSIASTKLLLRIPVMFGVLLAFANLMLQIESIHAAIRIFPTSTLSSLRASLALVGIPTKNDGLAVVLCLVPYALSGSIAKWSANKYFCIVSTVASTGLITVLVLGFSRAVYYALAFLIAAFIVLILRAETASFLRLGIVLASITVFAGTTVVYLGAERPVFDTLVGSRTVSQQMSTRGRVEIWRESASYIAGHPILGNGGGVDGVLALSKLGHSGLPFTARIYDAPLDILTSSGLIGLALYGLFLFYPLWIAVRLCVHSPSIHPLSPIPFILATGILALILRDITYSSLVSHGTTIVILWATVAIVQNANLRALTRRNVSRAWNSLDILIYVALGISCLSLVLSVRLGRAETHYSKGCIELMAGNYTQAHTEFTKAIQIEPKQPMFYAADALAATQDALGTSTTADLWHSLPAVTREQDILLATAESDYKKSLALTEDDATFWSNLAWIEAFRGETDSAADSFERAIQADPNDFATRIGAGLFYERGALEAKAIEEYAHAVAVSPRIVDSKFFEDLHVRRPDAARAIVVRACDLLNTLPASPIRLASLAKLHAFVGEVTLSHDEYVEVLTLLPNLSYAWANLGTLEFDRGNLARARTEFERARFIDGSNRLAANMLASIDFRDGNMDSAEDSYARALLLPEISVHAVRALRIYHVPAPVSDDLVPPRLLSYVSPEIHPLAICNEEWLTGLREADGESPDVSRRITAQEDLCNSH